MATTTANRMFKAAGFARKGNALKVRFTGSDIEKRLYRLKRDGQTAMDLIQLPRLMDKLGAARFLVNHFKSGPKHEAALHIVERLQGEAKPAAKKTAKKTAKPAKKAVVARKKAAAPKKVQTETPAAEHAQQAA